MLHLVEMLNCDMPLSSLCVTGGGSKSRFWLQMLADVLNSRVFQGKGDALLGAAMIATPGVTPSGQAESEVFAPAPAQAAWYKERYQRWIAGTE